MDTLNAWQDSPQVCSDPECAEETNGVLTAEPDQDGDHRYYECYVCDRIFGWDKVPTEVIAVDSEGGSCSVGIPEDIRRAASKPMERAMSEEQRKTALPILQIGRRPQ